MFILGHNPISDGWPGLGSRTGPPRPPPEPETAPVRVSAPVLVGTPKVGQTLTVSAPPIYSGNPAPHVAWRWQMRLSPEDPHVVVQNGGNLELTEAHAGMMIRTQDMGTNSVGSSVWHAIPWIGPVLAADPPPDP